MSRFSDWFLRLLGAVAAGYAAVAVVTFALYWGGYVLLGDIPSDAVVDWTIGATLVATALLVLWKTRAAPRVAAAPEDRPQRRRARPARSLFTAAAVDAPPRA